MKNVFFLIALLFTTALSFAQDIYVQGYYKSNGTYIQGHYRTAPPEKYICINVSNTQNTNPYLKKESAQSDTKNTTTSNTARSRSTYSAPTYRTTYTPTYTAPVNTYSTPSYAPSPNIYTGTRGGQYYVNSYGNKTYVSN